MAKIKIFNRDAYTNKEIGHGEKVPSVEGENYVGCSQQIKKKILQSQRDHLKGAQRSKSILIQTPHRDIDTLIEENPKLSSVIEYMKDRIRDINEENTDRYNEGQFKKILLSYCELSDIENTPLTKVHLENLNESYSSKFSNIRFNIKSFIKYTTSMMTFLDGITNKDINMLIICIVESIGNIVNNMKVKLSCKDAALLRLLYTDSNKGKQIEEESFKSYALNELNREYSGEILFNRSDITDSIKNLCDIKCIKFDGGMIKIIEKIQI